MNDDSMKKANEQAEPTQAALEEMPEVNEQQFRRRPGVAITRIAARARS